MSAIHPTALIDPGARLAADVAVGAYTIVGAGVEIAEGCRIGPHCVISGPTRIGRDTVIHSHATVGNDPQDKKFKGERTELLIGERNTIFEFTTISRGTQDGGGATRIGDDNWIMAYVHIAHDCSIGSQVIMANNAALAGHVTIEDWVVLGGYSTVHQFCKIGAHAFVGMYTSLTQDVPPFVLVSGNPAGARGVNIEEIGRAHV